MFPHQVKNLLKGKSVASFLWQNSSTTLLVIIVTLIVLRVTFGGEMLSYAIAIGGAIWFIGFCSSNYLLGIYAKVKNGYRTEMKFQTEYRYSRILRFGIPIFIVIFTLFACLIFQQVKAPVWFGTVFVVISLYFLLQKNVVAEIPSQISFDVKRNRVLEFCAFYLFFGWVSHHVRKFRPQAN